MLFFFCFSSGSLSAQVIRCATMEMDSVIRANNPTVETHQQFEDWLQDQIEYNAMTNANAHIINGVYTVQLISSKGIENKKLLIQK